MAIQLQLRRGTTAENNAFTGAVGEMSYDTDTNGLRIHDGNTQGGFKVDTVVAFQAPTAGNNYTWYRKYADGWVEQGGSLENTSGSNGTVNLPITMADTHYTAFIQQYNSGGYPLILLNKTTTSFDYSGNVGKDSWIVMGMAA